MSEAVGERVLDLHNRVLSLYILQDSGGRPIDGKTKTVHEAGTPSVQGWWLYMNGESKSKFIPTKVREQKYLFIPKESIHISMNTLSCRERTFLI